MKRLHMHVHPDITETESEARPIMGSSIKKNKKRSQHPQKWDELKKTKKQKHNIEHYSKAPPQMCYM